MANLWNRMFQAKNQADKKTDKKNLKRSTLVQSSRQTQDIYGWRQAINEAENNGQKYRVKMNTIYKDVILDGQVKSCISKRKNLTLLQDFALFDSNDNIDEEATKLIKKKYFADICNYVLDTVFYGYNLINWTDVKNNELLGVQIINREFINPDGMFIGEHPYATQGIDIMDESIQNWSLYCTTPSENGISNCGYGLLYEAANYQILSRNNLAYNADFSERFGMPVTVLTTDRQDGEDLDIVEDNLKNMGSNGYLVKDSTDVIDYLEFSNSDNGYQVYDNLEKRLEAKITKLLLGHASALDETPGKLGASQGESSPVSEALKEIKSVDSVYLAYYINDFLIPKLRNLGIKIKDGLTFKFINSDEKDEADNKLNTQRTEVTAYVKTLAEAGYTVDAKWLSDELGIPIYKVTEVQNTEKKKVTNESNAFDSVVFKIFNQENIIYDYNLFKTIKNDLDLFKNSGVKNDAYHDRLDLVHGLMQADSVRFSFAKTQEEINKLNSIYKKDMPYSKFKEEALSIDNQYNKNYLKTEFDTAYNRMLNTDEYLDKSTRYKFATWRQIQRITARDEHKYLNGKTFSVSTLPALPPIGYNCGCELEYSNEPGDLQTPSYFKSDKIEYNLMVKQGFWNNPAKTGEVFGSGYDEYKKSISLKDQGFNLNLFTVSMLSLKKNEKWLCNKQGNEWLVEKMDLEGNAIETLNLSQEVFLNLKNMIIL